MCISCCHFCPRKGPIIDHQMHCLESGKNILEHNEANECPLGRFGPLPFDEHSPTEEVRALLAKPILLKPVMLEWENVRAAHRQILNEFIDACPADKACATIFEHGEASPGILRARELRGQLMRFPNRYQPYFELDDTATAKLRIIQQHEPPIVFADHKHGDLLTLLPAMKRLHESGRKVVYVCPRPYGQTLEGLDWVKCIEIDEENMDVVEAVARQHGELIETRSIRPRMRNWSIQSWARTGLAESQFHSLPLVIENRRPDAEAALAKKHIQGGRPLVLVNCAGLTSPYAHGEKLLTYLRGKLRGCEILDLSTLRAERFRDLLGLYEKADVLISVDTGTLHLAYALRMPTIAIRADDPWLASEPREHWKLHLTHAESATDEGLQAIEKAVLAVLMGNRQQVSLAEMIGHGVMGIARALTGTGGATAEMIEERTATCRTCEHATSTLGVPKCLICGCMLAAKVRNAKEHCPVRKW